MWMVAPSYAHATIISVNEDTHKALIKYTCDRCGGNGYYAIGTHNGQPVLSPYDGGVCYECGGKKYITKEVKAYTEEEYAKYIASRERAKERKAEKREAEKKMLENESENNRVAVLHELGYDETNPCVWIVTGENTYEVKDVLKEAGCKYKPELGWYCSHKIEVPAGCILLSIPLDEVFNWKPYIKKFLLKEDAKEKVDAVKAANMPESTSDFIGTEKERLRDLVVTLVSFRSIENYYGTSILYTFKMGDNVLTWFCSGEGLPQDIEKGDTLYLTGTVKKHEIYNGVKQTVLSRCKAVKA